MNHTFFSFLTFGAPYFWGQGISTAVCNKQLIIFHAMAQGLIDYTYSDRMYLQVDIGTKITP